MELAHQALSSTEQGYDLLAPKFEYTPFRTPDEVLQPVMARLDGDVESALDICCGTGAAMRYLRPMCRRRVVGIDMSRGMLAEADRLLQGVPGRAGMELVRGNALTMPFTAEFDLATCFGALGHILPRDQPRFISRVARILKPGGRFVFVTGYCPPVRSRAWWFARLFNGAMHVRNFLLPTQFIMYYLTFCLPEVRRLFEEQGFSVQTVDDLFEGPLASLKMVVATRPCPTNQ